ncbi:hypothetical protein EJ08DRAFT_21422 [Tothia fuscella]|uniref:Uncharacterized protein n=1 Tax=Tothia fuscella TaxID=1048955 RepID=A0A9P4U0W5_9PEZI|nr:hypothetical protein EJ08DRAFT_21422 [Tothia fuscella]
MSNAATSTLANDLGLLPTSGSTTLESSPTTSPCPAAGNVRACLNEYSPSIPGCSDDYVCLCLGSTLLLECYDNCRDDPARVGVVAQVDLFCRMAQSKRPGASSSTISSANPTFSTQINSSIGFESSTSKIESLPSDPAAPYRGNGRTPGDDSHNPGTYRRFIAHIWYGILSELTGENQKEMD